MIELADNLPDVNVLPAEYRRLLGYPPGKMPRGRARELAQWARAWYLEHGKPWVYAREEEKVELAEDSVRVGGIPFRSPRLRRTLAAAEAHSVILAAVSAGPELEQEAQKLWKEEKPDEYFFLEIFGSAVVEHLVTHTGARLCGWAETHGAAVLPHASPGYPEWDIADQPRLLELMRQTRTQAMPQGLDVLESGMLKPKKSLLAVFGLTRRREHLTRLTDLVPCEGCSYRPCAYRRAPYRGDGVRQAAEPALVVESPPAYTVHPRALERWSKERLTLTRSIDGTIDARFRFDGTTCTNMGRALAFDYSVQLGSREDGYPIRRQQCAPAADDAGHAAMCRYLDGAEQLMTAIGTEKPLAGKPLRDVFGWARPECAPACYCDPGSRDHKWGLVFETIHYFLSEQEKRSGQS